MQRRRGYRWAASIIVGLAALSGCTVERIGPAGVTMTRPIRVRAEDVRVFRDPSMVTDTFSIIDQVYVCDDAVTQPRVLEERLRGLAGVRGANAIILDPMNRPDNGVRVDLRPTLDKPFEYFQATAVWIGDGLPPHRYLGTLDGNGG